MPLRVLHLYAGNLYGGIERMLVTLARERSACPQMEPYFGLCFKGRLSRELRECGACVYELGHARFSRPWTVLAARRRLREVLRSERFDVAICHSNWPLALFGRTCRDAHLPLSFWVHDAPGGRHWTERLASLVAPDVVIANSAYTASMLREKRPRTPTTIVYPPVPDMALLTMHLNRSALRRSFGAGEAELVILQVSRLEEAKGHLVLIDALARLPDDVHWKCLISAVPQRPPEQELLRTLQQRIDQLALRERIRLFSNVHDVAELFAVADIYCQPNISPEGFGLTFVEAMYCGIPVVTSGIGGGAEVVDASCGTLTDPGDVPGVVSALLRLARDAELRSDMGVEGRSRAAALCGPASVLPRLHAVLTAELIAPIAAHAVAPV